MKKVRKSKSKVLVERDRVKNILRGIYHSKPKRKYRKPEMPTLNKSLEILLGVGQQARKFLKEEWQIDAKGGQAVSDLVEEFKELIFDANASCSKLSCFVHKHPKIAKLVASFRKSWISEVHVKNQKNKAPNFQEIITEFQELGIGTRLPSVNLSSNHETSKCYKGGRRSWKIPVLYARVLYDAIADVLCNNGICEMTIEEFEKSWKIIDSNILRSVLYKDADYYVLQAGKEAGKIAQLRDNIRRSLISLLKETKVLKES